MVFFKRQSVNGKHGKNASLKLFTVIPINTLPKIIFHAHEKLKMILI